jgi:hypothetical protein
MYTICTKYGKRGETGNLKKLALEVEHEIDRSYTISVSAGPTSFLPDLNTLTEISESM